MHHNFNKGNGLKTDLSRFFREASAAVFVCKNRLRVRVFGRKQTPGKNLLSGLTGKSLTGS